MALPDFLIIGAMKCGTSTLQAQLAAQPGVFMTDPKEPNFFSDDEIYAKGMDWYQALFAGAPEGALKGEASTHYTKAPTYPDCINRMKAALDRPKLIYMIRNPIDRMVSQYMHEWTMGLASGEIDQEIDENPIYKAYSRYPDQIAPFVEWVGADNILISSQERLRKDGAAELAAVAAFLGLPAPTWREETADLNASAARLRRFPGYDLLISHPFSEALRRRLAPRALRDFVKSRLQIRERPQLSPEKRSALEAEFAADHARLEALVPGEGRYADAYDFA